MTAADLAPPLDDDAALAALASPAFHALAAAADAVRARHHGDVVGYRRSGEAPDAAAFTWSADDEPPVRLAALRRALATPGIAAIRLVRADDGADGTGIDDLTTMAWARLVVSGPLDLVAPWHAFGAKVAQVALECGVNDLGRVETDEDEEHLRRWVSEAGREPTRRDA